MYLKYFVQVMYNFKRDLICIIISYEFVINTYKCG